MSIVLAFMFIVLLVTFPGWHEERDEAGSDIEVRPFPSRPVSQIACVMSGLSSVFAGVGILWQHSGAVAAATIAEASTYGNVKAAVGSTAMILGWLSEALVVIACTGIIIMVLSIRALDMLTY